MSARYEFDENFRHEITLEVPFFMTDYSDGIYHSRYLDLYHQARDSFFSEAGYPYKELIARNYYVVIVDLHVTYRKAVNFYEKIMIRSRLASVKDKSFFMVQEMWKKEDGEEVFCNRLEVTHVCVSPERKAISIPDFFLEKLVSFQNGVGK